MRKTALAFLCLTISLISHSQEKLHQPLFSGMYFQWGYNGEVFSRSNIHFIMSNGDNFILHHARAHDRGNFDAIYKETLQISIPQYNYRIGLYLNKKHNRSLEINFDHAKYILADGQTVHVTGTINGQHVDGDSVVNPQTFLHFEHSDGANWLHINYVWLYTVLNSSSNSRALLQYLWKAGAGINIPRTDFNWKGERLNNNFHIAGYNISAEAGLRFYPAWRFFIEATGKTGFVKYVDALANTPTAKGNRAHHAFTYLEGIFTVGWDINY
jgi:hypothetical protein